MHSYGQAMYGADMADSYVHVTSLAHSLYQSVNQNVDLYSATYTKVDSCACYEYAR